MHILSITEKLEDVWSYGITKEKEENLISLEEKAWLVQIAKCDWSLDCS